MAHILHPYPFKSASPYFYREVERLLAQASLPALKQIKFLSHGMENDTYRLITEDGDYILTLFDKGSSDLNPSLIIQGSYLFTKHGFPLPKILSYGTIDDQKAFISTYLEGKVKSHWSVEDYEAVGFFLGTLHKCAETFSATTPLLPYPLKLLFEYEELHSQIPPEFRALEQELLLLEESWPFSLPKGLIHGDLWYKNLLFSGGEISALLDFTAPSYDVLLLDLANLIKGISFSPNLEEKEEKIVSLLSSYQSARTLSPLELTSLPLLVKAKLLSTILYLVKKSIFHPEKREECLKAALLNLLKLEEAKEIVRW